MTPNLQSFAAELIKLSAFPQQEHGAEPYDASSSIGKTMEDTSGASARANLRAGAPVMASPAPKKLAPTPMTSPNAMVDVASRGA